MKILITGARGMLAQAVKERFARDGENEIVLTDLSGKKVGEVASGGISAEEVVSNGNAEVDSLFLDITDAEGVRAVFEAVQPELVINCAAYTAVDKAETQEELARKINADGPGNLARACAELGKSATWEAANGREGGPVLVHISTDYVFGGAKPTTEEYSEDDEKFPETVYGRTKLEGEEQIVSSGCNYYIFRTAWLYGEGANFVRTMISVGRAASSKDAPLARGAEDAAPADDAERKSEAFVTVVDDQHGSPTYTEDLTDIIYQAVTKQIPFGIYNATDLGFTTWCDFTKKIYELAGINCSVVGITSAEYEAQAKARARAKMEAEVKAEAGAGSGAGTKAGTGTGSGAATEYKVAKRPLNSKMSKQKLLDAGVEIPTWEDGLKRYLKKELN